MFISFIEQIRLVRQVAEEQPLICQKMVDEEGRRILSQRLANDLGGLLKILEPLPEQLVGVGVKSTHNWYWLVDGLQEESYEVKLVNAPAIRQ